MEQTSTPPLIPQEPKDKPETSWGLFIGLFLILIVIVAGAYYAYTERIAPQIHPQTPPESAN
jgi:hypothetical protein